jgi:hypothetical protein
VESLRRVLTQDRFAQALLTQFGEAIVRDSLSIRVLRKGLRQHPPSGALRSQDGLLESGQVSLKRAASSDCDIKGDGLAKGLSAEPWRNQGHLQRGQSRTKDWRNSGSDGLLKPATTQNVKSQNIGINILEHTCWRIPACPSWRFGSVLYQAHIQGEKDELWQKLCEQAAVEQAPKRS